MTIGVSRKFSCGGGDAVIHSSVNAFQGLAGAFFGESLLPRVLQCAIRIPERVSKLFSLRRGIKVLVYRCAAVLRIENAVVFVLVLIEHVVQALVAIDGGSRAGLALKIGDAAAIGEELHDQLGLGFPALRIIGADMAELNAVVDRYRRSLYPTQVRIDTASCERVAESLKIGGLTLIGFVGDCSREAAPSALSPP